ncbi:protein YkfC-like [Haemaphysalis longicornis]
MIGFRPSLSTQDAMKLIKYQIIDRDTRNVRAILGLYLENAFDSVSHAHILDSISKLGLGHNFHAFISSFLGHRKATLKIGDLKSEPIQLGTRGTPQGSVVSPLLFNIAMCKLSPRLSEVKGNTLYAGNITVWCVGGCEGRVEEVLQEALDRTEAFLAGMGLRLS